MSNEIATSNSHRPSLPQPSQTVAPKLPMDVFRGQLERRQSEIAAVLPQHISIERFVRTALTAVLLKPDILNADRGSLMVACYRAAQDGLMPDGKEGAFVMYNTKVKNDQGRDVWVPAVQWLPMVGGVVKKMRNSGELASLVAHEVYAKDEFSFVLGDNEGITHKPYMGEEEPGPIVAAYAIAKLKDGTIQREVIPQHQLKKIRAASKSANGPAWSNWEGEMSRKSVVKRLSKYLPMSTEVERALGRDEDSRVRIGQGATIDLRQPAIEPLPLSDGRPDGEVEQIGYQQPVINPETGEVLVQSREVEPTQQRDPAHDGKTNRASSALFGDE